ncbi:methionyl-tRNA formyltransferase [Glaciecola siphonariae]|uniref:Methionyl-tRNA formyltransferase n=1 Tax=Glaciecola siphonariae TaxID=521012 RepID=A0ABV9LRR5_9ALTE
MNIIFAGTPEFAASHLSALIEAGHNIVAVYTQPDRPSGRGKKLRPSAVKSVAQQHDIDVYQPPTLKSEDALTQLSALNADLMVVVAYGLILPKPVLEAPKFGCINVHGSLLPKWRGAAPIQRALWAGDSKTGVAIMQMDEGLDTGDVLLTKAIEIEPLDTSATLYQKLAELGPQALVECIERLHSIAPIKQNDALATHAKKLSKEEARCDWSLSCEQLARNIRAFNPWPMAWFEHNGAGIKIHSGEAHLGKHDKDLGTVTNYNKSGLDIACSDGILRITRLQLPGKKPQLVSEIVNGNPHLFTVNSKLHHE